MTVALTPDGESWFDPEVVVHDGTGWITWQDRSGDVRLAQLDLADGTVVDDSVVSVAADGAAMLDTFNGPELGVDAQGLSVWYTADTPDGQRTARATVDSTGVGPVQLITGTGFVSPLPSRNATSATTRVLAVRRPPDFGTVVWFDETTPSSTTDLVHIEHRDDGDARWIVGTDLITASGALPSGAAVELVDTDTGKITPVGARQADEPVDDPYGWVDPATGEVSVLAVMDGTQLVVWSVDPSGTPAEVSRLASPDPAHPYLGSPEPFLVDGRPWVSLTVADQATTVPGRTDQQVWLMPLDGGTATRCDDGAAEPTTRVDPEVIVAPTDVFAYYYAWKGSTSIVHRCAVDLRGAPFVPDAAVAAGHLVALDPTTTGPDITPDFGDHLVGTPAHDARGELLVFFPGTGAQPHQYRTFLQHALDLGYHVIGLAYPNDLSVNFDLCRGTTDPACTEHAREEVLHGTDAPGLPLHVDPADAAVPRLTAALEKLASTHPDQGWDRYLDAGGQPAWGHIATAGHSQGGGHAAFLGRDLELARVVLFDATEPASWTTQPMATPSDRMWGLAHAEEPNVTPIERSWQNLDLPGEIVTIEDGNPPWSGSHRLITSTEGCRGDPASRGFHHNCPVVDDSLPTPVPPSLLAAWDRLLVG